MVIPIEGFSVVAQLERIQPLLDNDAVEIPNATALADKHIWRCSFMAHADAQKFLKALEDAFKINLRLLRQEKTLLTGDKLADLRKGIQRLTKKILRER